MLNPFKWFRTRRVRKEQAKRERLGMAYHVDFSTEIHHGRTRGAYAGLHMAKVNPRRELS